MIHSYLLTDGLLVQQNHDEFMYFDADQQSKASQKKLKSDVVDIEGRDAKDAAYQVQQITQHVNEEVLVVPLTLPEHKYLLLIQIIAHLLTCEYAVMMPFPHLCDEVGP